MVRAEQKKKRAKKGEPKQIKLSNKLQKELVKNKITPLNQSKRITRSQFQEINNNSLKSSSPQNTCSKSNILPLPHFSPRKTRSKSEKKQRIASNFDTKRQESSIVIEKEKKETKISVRSEFVKVSAFEVNSIVLAKQKYSVPWPAKVLQIEKERAFVYFFGDKRSGYVAKNEIYDFILSAKAVKSIIESKKKSLTYNTGVVEIEKLLGISSDASIVNQL